MVFTSFAYSPSTTTFLQSFSSDLSSQSCFKSHLFSRGWQEPSLHVNSSSEHFVSVKNWVFSPSQNLSLVTHFFLPTGRPSCYTKIDIFLIPYFISTSKGQLISKCPFSLIVSTKIPTIFLRISALGSKEVEWKKEKSTSFFNYLKIIWFWTFFDLTFF